MSFPRSSTGPDEFLVAPAKPLQDPPAARALPAPTPGLANRADPTPKEDAVAALGGNPARVRPTGSIPGSDAGLVNYASRGGRDPAIRGTLAQEDLDIRRRNNGLLLERWAGVNLYYEAYQNQSLNQYGEADRFRRAGAETPSAPPESFEGDGN